jgi:hypothetical protein
MEELQEFCSTTNIVWLIKSIRVKGEKHVSHMGARRNECTILVGKSGGRKPFRRFRLKWVIVLKLILKE